MKRVGGEGTPFVRSIHRLSVTESALLRWQQMLYIANSQPFPRRNKGRFDEAAEKTGTLA